MWNNVSMSVSNSKKWTPLMAVMAAVPFCGHAARTSNPYTPTGHNAATHVMRLHRYDHSGVQSMMEAEAQWHSSLLQVDQPRKNQPQFLQVSNKQWQQLQSHHQEHAQIKRSLKARTHSAKHKAISADQKKDSFASGGFQAMALTEISHSQYVGPIGIGSLLSPDGCDPSSLVESNSSASMSPQTGSALIQKRVKCSVADQSQVWVVLDTGSTNIWIASDLCQQGPCAHADRTRYNHSVSATYRTPDPGVDLSVQFGTGRLEGPQGIDDFHIGPFTVKGQVFGMMREQIGRVFEDVPFEGILGLAWPSMSANQVRPFFDTIIEEKVLERNEFAFYFSPDSVTANAVFWGGVDPAFYEGDIEHFPVVDPYYWAIELVTFKIGDEELLACEGDCSAEMPSPDNIEEFRRYPKAIVDTGTTFFTAETPLFNAIMSKLRGGLCSEITSDTHANITFSLRNSDGEVRDFSLTPNQYMTSSGEGEFARCSPAFMKINVPEAHGPAMLLGECFLRHYFAVFDRQGDKTHGTVGLAKASHSPESMDRLKELTGNQPVFGAADEKNNES